MLFTAFVYVHVECVHGGGGGGAHIFSEASTEHLAQLCSILSFETETFTKPGVPQFSKPLGNALSLPPPQ